MSAGLQNLNLLFFKAAERGDVKQARAMLELGANVDFTYQSRNAMHHACAKGHLPMAAFLIDAEINATLQDDAGDYPVHRAASMNQSRMLHFMGAKGYPLSKKNLIGTLPIWETLLKKNYDSFSALLDMGQLENEFWNRDYSHVRNQARRDELVDFQVLLTEYDRVADAIDAETDGAALKDYLLTPGNTQRVPLCSAAAWFRLPQILERMDAAGVHFTRDELNGEGAADLLTRAVECHQLDALAHHLSEHGESLCGEDFVNPETGEATRLLEKAVETCQLGDTLNTVRHHGDEPRTARLLLGVVPEAEAEWQVPNLHGLLSDIAREQRQITRG